VSHELRTPLNGILGWAHYLQRARVDAATLAEGIAAIERGARSQAQLVDDLLDMNRITTGRLALELRPVAVRDVIESAIATVRPAATVKNVALETSFDSSNGTVVGDPDRLQQVIWNLLSNAVKFTPGGGRVDVATRRAGGNVEIEVRDTGVGIEPDFLPHAFDRFRQADSSMTRSHGGMGLGLSIAKQLTELHGGTIRVASDGRDRGATFTVRLPMAAVRGAVSAAAADDENTPAEPPLTADFRALDLSGIEVLVVDDDRDTRELVERVLKGHRARVSTAASAAEALTILRERKVNVLVSDIGMPGTDGYELIRAVRDDLEIDSATTPAVAVTAYARSEDRARAMLAGYQMHIAKPIEPQELAATVASFVGRTHSE
jgi:CheY-like chemotaxis protein